MYPADFPPEPFARLESAAVSVKLWPLITRREVQIGTVTLAGPDVRLTELGDARHVQDLIDAGRPGGMLAPVREASREIEEMRLLAERLAFMWTRMHLLISLQVEMATAKA